METVHNPWTEMISVEEAFRAAQELAVIYWETGGKLEDEIAQFCTALKGDPALEQDFLAALARVRG